MDGREALGLVYDLRDNLCAELRGLDEDAPVSVLRHAEERLSNELIRIALILASHRGGHHQRTEAEL
jgi:hypothetical protein